MTLRRLAPAFSALALTLVPGAASAADWRFCLAPDRKGHHVYLTSPFASGADLRSLEEGFGTALRDIGAAFDTVQCPRADSEARADEMRRWSERYNLQEGMTAATVDWSPGNTLALLRGTR